MARKIKEDALDLPQDAAPGYYAREDFEIKIGDLPFAFKKGERFDVPLGWRRDPAAEELLQGSRRKNTQQTGLVFVYEGKIINPEEKNLALRERQVHAAVLPLEER